MSFFSAYIKDRRIAITAFLLFSAIFSVSFFLYQLPLEAVLYPIILNGILALALAVLDYGKVRKKRQELARIKKLTADMLVSLPKVSAVYDDVYNDIIDNLNSQVIRIENETAEKYADMMDYYSVWVHQIKAPIASMRLTLQNDDSALSRTIRSDLFRIEQYVEMVLAFLRLDSDSSDYVFKEYRMDDILRKVVRKFSSEFIHRKISLRLELYNFSFITDEKWFVVVVEQILSNALKYTRKGSIRIYMSKPETLCIEDTGIGIASDDLPRIFERGYTGYNGRTDANASGLGLYLCKRICNNLSIGIRAESEVDKGTKLLLNLNQSKLQRE